MSERIAAKIQIGGKVRQSVAAELCNVIATERVSLEWGGSPFVPRTVDELLATRFENGDGLLTLRLYDDEASWGECHWPFRRETLQCPEIARKVVSSLRASISAMMFRTSWIGMMRRISVL